MSFLLKCHSSQESFSLFHSKVLNILMNIFPKKHSKSIYTNRKPWISEKLKRLITRKKKLYASLKSRSGHITEKEYKCYRNTKG